MSAPRSSTPEVDKAALVAQLKVVRAWKIERQRRQAEEEQRRVAEQERAAAEERKWAEAERKAAEVVEKWAVELVKARAEKCRVEPSEMAEK